MPARKEVEQSPRPEGWVGWTLQPDGTIDIPIRGKVYSLAAPTIGQLRDVELAHAKANAQVMANIKAIALPDGEVAADAVPDPVAITEAKYERIDIWSAWWMTVFETLGTEAPAKDDLPPFMASGTNSVVALGHWQSTPPVPGGG